MSVKRIQRKGTVTASALNVLPEPSLRKAPIGTLNRGYGNQHCLTRRIALIDPYSGISSTATYFARRSSSVNRI